ncbi:MAG: RtcB family protein, partial [candidate division WOR-3 bacterium]
MSFRIEDLERAGDYLWTISPDKVRGMNVPAHIYASDRMLGHIISDNAPQQVINVARLPGIVMASIAMPDIHWGYGFPIGGVAAFEMKKGVISPGGVGYDINCGVRLLATNLRLKDLKPRLEKLVDKMFSLVPAGVGSSGRLTLTDRQLGDVSERGALWAIRERGFGWDEDLLYTEERGSMEGADFDAVSQRARQRGLPQLGTLGSGNHFLEIQEIDEIYDDAAAKALGLEKGLITLMIHTGSRGFGHQIADDYIKIMKGAMREYGIQVPDTQLACAPIDSPEGKRYFGAMVAAANYAWANRQIITHRIREAFAAVMLMSPEELGLSVIYDVAHNIAKKEEHLVNGKKMKLVVHRKGATRAFPAGHPDVPEKYRKLGQPVLIPGDMGRYSFVLVGQPRAMESAFGSTCHGAGRVMSRARATKSTTPASVKRTLSERGILIRAHTD